MLIFFFLGMGITLAICLPIILTLYARTRKLPCFAPPTSLVSKAIRTRYRPHEIAFQSFKKG